MKCWKYQPITVDTYDLLPLYQRYKSDENEYSSNHIQRKVIYGSDITVKLGYKWYIDWPVRNIWSFQRSNCLKMVIKLISKPFQLKTWWNVIGHVFTIIKACGDAASGITQEYGVCQILWCILFNEQPDPINIMCVWPEFSRAASESVQETISDSSCTKTPKWSVHGWWTRPKGHQRSLRKFHWNTTYIGSR